MSSDGKWKTIKAPKRPTVVATQTWTGSYQAPFVAGGIKAADKTYKRSLSVGRFTTIKKVYDTGKVTFSTERTGRRHIHYNKNDQVHTPSHIPTDGETVHGPMRPGAVKKFDK